MNKRPILALGCALSVIVLGGCGPTDYVEDRTARNIVLVEYFSQGAWSYLNQVPMRVGELPGNVYGTAIDGGLLTLEYNLRLWWEYGYPIERQVIVVDSSFQPLILHEYIHQAEFSGLVSRQKLAEVLARPDTDYVARSIAMSIRNNIVRTYDGADEDRIQRELLAFLPMQYAFRSDLEWPPELVDVYIDALRFDNSTKRFRVGIAGGDELTEKDLLFDHCGVNR